jgi:hypothetical protein
MTLAFTVAELRKYKSLLKKCSDALDLERDEEIVLEALRLLLKGEGYATESATSPAGILVPGGGC